MTRANNHIINMVKNARHVDFAERAQTKRALEGALSLSSKGPRDSGFCCGLFVWRERSALHFALFARLGEFVGSLGSLGLVLIVFA
jgi:hypothetical protein